MTNISTWWKRDTLSTKHVDNGVCSTSRTERMCLHCQKVYGGMYFRQTSVNNPRNKR